ncbi:nitrile hydratase subunit alpha [Pseudovibrio sp. SCP19]|uniref:nitrile hydratase subunit alpha n=1 Tax=Pseudovibrio sp. SCP19 TaxID=3141374 RepID=UPI003339E808
MNQQDNNSFAERDYRRMINDPDYRQRLIEDPKGTLSETTGYTFPEDVRVEVIEQEPDTICMMIPIRPKGDEAQVEQALHKSTERTFDLLFSSGIGGYFIPSDKLKWVLRDMRRSWISKLGLKL